MSETEDIKSDAIDSDAGGKAHTPEGEHPAGTGERTDRQVGGPVAGDDAEPTTGGAKGDIKTRGFEDDPHQ
jgi:hypothetical protein